MSLRFSILECMYEINTKKKLTDAIAEDEVSYMRRMNEKPVEINEKASVVKLYEEQKDDKNKIEEIEEKMFVYNNEQAKKGL